MDQTLTIEEPFKCLGYILNENIWTQFPFHQLKDDSLPFKFENGVFHSISCHKNNYIYLINDENDQISYDCQFLEYNNRLNTMIKEFHPKLNNEYLSWDQLTLKTNSYQDKIRNLKLQELNNALKIIIYSNKIDMFKRFQLLLAEQNVTRVRSLMKTCLNKKRGVMGIIRIFTAAANKVFQPKQWTEEDIDLATLLLRIGGPALLYAFNKENRLPCSSYIYKVNILNITPLIKIISIEIFMLNRS